MTRSHLTRMTRIEVVIPASTAADVRALIRSSGGVGYTSITGVSGLGHHSYRSGPLLFNDQAALDLMITVVPDEQAGVLIRGLRMLLDTTPGVMLVSDTYVSRPDYFRANPDPDARPDPAP